jgi:four helix bundle protein
MVNSYKDLVVFQKSKTLTIDVVKYFKKNKTDRSNDFLLNQVFRSVSSVGANLAEGFGRNYSQNFKQFVGIARGSSFETEYWLEILLELNDFDSKIIREFIERNTEINKMLTGLMKNMKGGPTKY